MENYEAKRLKHENASKMFWARSAKSTDLQELLAALRTNRSDLPAAVRARWDAYDMSLQMIAQYEREAQELK